MDRTAWFYIVTPYTSFFGLMLILVQLFHDWPALAVAVVVVSLFNIVAYGFQVAHRRYGEFIVPEICVFCWAFIAVINVLRLALVS